MDPLFTAILWILSLSLVGIGIVGLALPALPGAPVVFAGLFLAAWAEDFAYIGWKALTVLAVMAAFTYVLDFFATIVGAERFGASWRGIAGAALGAVIGLLWAPIGVLIGPFIGAVAGELTLHRSLRRASAAGLGATVGLVVGVALKLSIAIMMIGIVVVLRIQGAF